MGAIDYLALLGKLNKNAQGRDCTNCTNEFTQFVQSPTLAQKVDFLPAEAQAATPADERIELANPPDDETDALPDRAAEARRQRERLPQTCSACVHRSPWGSCLEPVSAGLSRTFKILTASPDHEKTCPAFLRISLETIEGTRQ